MKKSRTKERSLKEPKVLSSREHRYNAKKYTKLEPVCKYMCYVYIKNGKGYELRATTKKRLIVMQGLHKESHAGREVSFSEIKYINHG
jgi:hypothetical protein